MQSRESLQKILTQAGLTQNESLVYLALLELGPTTVLKLARQSGVKRTTIYHVVEGLKTKGLVGIEERGFKQFLIPENPARLKTILDEQKKALQSSFPELEALYTLKGNDSVVRYYSGVQAMRSVYDELLLDLRANDDYFVFGDPKRWDIFDKTYFKTFIERRLKINLNAKVILVASETAEAYKKTERNYREEVRILPTNTTLDANMTITPRKIVIHPLTHPITTIVIETGAFVRLQHDLFKIVWQSLKE